jgi:sigma-E factor negative regulatory protein RseC
MPRPPDVTAVDAVERIGVVVHVTADSISVRCDRTSGCALCARGFGCGGGLLGALAGGPPLLRVPRQNQRVGIGDRVRVALPAGRVGSLAAAAYGLPLAGLVLGALAATSLPALAGDAGTAVGGLAGLLCGGMFARHRLLAGGALDRCRPTVERLPPGDERH